MQATDLAKRFEADGVSAIVYTDIAKDGMMQGCNVEATAALAAASRIPVIASGGIHNLGDIEKLLLARQRATAEIDRMLAGRSLPRFHRILVDQAWADVLSLTVLRNG